MCRLREDAPTISRNWAERPADSASIQSHPVVFDAERTCRGSGACRSSKIAAVRRLFVSAGVVFAALAASVAAKTAPLTLQEAIAKVERETGAKVLSAETKHASRQTV